MSTGVITLSKSGSRFLSDLVDRKFGPSCPVVDTSANGAIVVDWNIQHSGTIDEARSVMLFAHDPVLGEKDELVFLEMTPADAVELGHALIASAGRAAGRKKDHTPWLTSTLCHIDGLRA